MKKIITLLTIVLFTINVSAQQTKAAVKENAKKESCCAKHDANAKTMTPKEIALCQAKCKAEGKKCTAADMAKCKTDGKKCTAADMAKCIADGKKCTAADMAKCNKKEEKKCCSKKI
ncbi:MAG: hypothetical protein PHC28_05980 [Flavobacterium sp.]|uniref:hypothetical protein n=1 Tax=Flavobacterium sp. TaxID=239 RepID=UPI00261043DE|nr:hypothetical protein [Flavobacterium sp.]MDD5150018.1 hypothetical protein [Flavobacterium sp.]